MSRPSLSLCLAVLGLAQISATALAKEPAKMTAAAKPAASPLYDLTVKTLAGEPQSLAQYRGKVLLIVNTASECGYTPQYAGLEALHGRYKDRDLVVIGVPSNDFGAQEPGGAATIAKFCQVRYGVTFPLWEKTKTIGPDAAPLYKLLAKGHGAPKWNFHKYLVGRDGQVRAAFPSSIEPDSKELKSAIDAALAESPPA